VLTTPAILDSGWRPATMAGSALVAAAVPEPIAVSGWDLARGGPKPNVFAVPAGSVYFAEGDVRPADDSLSDRPEDRLEGWGCFLKGVWNHA
jgi:CRISPR-associated protein Cmr3